jgi:hypothetical protein
MDAHATLYVADDSEFSLPAAAALLRAWEGPRPHPDHPKPPPTRIDLVGEGELRVFFGDWCVRLRWEEGERGRRAVVESDPVPEERPRSEFASDEAYEDYLSEEYNNHLDDVEWIDLLVEHFRGVSVCKRCNDYRFWTWHGKDNEDSAVAVPTHLSRWLTRTQLLDARRTLLEGAVRCPCGEERLEFQYPGQTHVPGGLPCTVKLEGSAGYWFAIKAVCTACGQECLVFDSDRHGWDAFPCRISAAEPPAGPLSPWQCRSCGSRAHTGVVRVRYDTPEKFLEESQGRYAVERRVDAFGWVEMDLKCCGCGDATEPWVSYETA